MPRRAPAVKEPAPGRLDTGPPVGVIDIGSNSIRLVVYEGLTRSPTPIFNEKVLAGLGREVLSTGLLAADAVERAYQSLRRFRVLCDTIGVKRLWVVATAACRDAENGPEFIRQAQRICRAKIDVLSGKREAMLSALGIVSGIHEPDGIVGDLGGGSLELVDARGTRLKGGITLPLGGLALQDISARSLKKAERIVDTALRDVRLLKGGAGRAFYAVGGTWRALTRLHMRQTGYPLHVMHNYIVPAKEALEFVRLVRRVNPEILSQIDSISETRRPLLAYAAIVLEHIIRYGKPREIVVSATGVREGLLYEALGERERRRDPLVAASMELNQLRSRSPAHGLELVDWTDAFMASTGIEETDAETRLRHAACLLGDIAWRAHPDYRGEQSFNVISHANFLGVDHPGRAFLALAVYFRHVGLFEGELAPGMRELATARMIDRARVLGGAMRVAYLISSAMPGVLPETPLVVRQGQLQLSLTGRYTALAGERVANRLRQLARLIGREAVLVT
ncbi:Guanosine-5'-triphosphate,3'-diphosphate pyrophosphatase [Rhodoplanes serenus]|uniref:exopolyphosphatase n=1 Tax=Rhodoplanes serenus TaxID=200615 RepID=A0A3S4FBU0_9BRAD|nr:Guanosine-5'-triphosphate,3'-diphosphate pyrophosphatase [Rhodoplanes serenus]